MRKFLIILLLTSACATQTSDKNVKIEVISRDQQLEQLHLNLEVTLEDLNHTPIKGVNVNVSGQSDKDQDVTDSYGIADIAISVYKNESLDFRFHSKSQNIEWTKTVERLPTGKKDITFVFRKNPKGNIELAEISY